MRKALYWRMLPVKAFYVKRCRALAPIKPGVSYIFSYNIFKNINIKHSFACKLYLIIFEQIYPTGLEMAAAGPDD